jgi:hypothetical protein
MSEHDATGDGANRDDTSGTEDGEALVEWWKLPPVDAEQNSILLRWADEDPVITDGSPDAMSFAVNDDGTIDIEYDVDPELEAEGQAYLRSLPPFEPEA